MAIEIFVHVVFKKKYQNHLQTMRRIEFELKIPTRNFNEATHFMCSIDKSSKVTYCLYLWSERQVENSTKFVGQFDSTIH